MDDNLIKIRFELDPSDWHGQPNEGFWAEPAEGAKPGTAFRLRNSPFFATGISFLDIVTAVPRTDGGAGLRFAGVISRSGHSTYMLLVSPERNKEFEQFWWPRLENLGCTYESTTKHFSVGHKTLYSIDVPAASNVYAVLAVLGEGERHGIWMAQEGHCGHKLTE